MVFIILKYEFTAFISSKLISILYCEQISGIQQEHSYFSHFKLTLWNSIDHSNSIRMKSYRIEFLFFGWKYFSQTFEWNRIIESISYRAILLKNVYSRYWIRTKLSEIYDDEWDDSWKRKWNRKYNIEHTLSHRIHWAGHQFYILLFVFHFEYVFIL